MSNDRAKAPTRGEGDAHRLARGSHRDRLVQPFPVTVLREYSLENGPRARTKGPEYQSSHAVQVGAEVSPGTVSLLRGTGICYPFWFPALRLQCNISQMPVKALFVSPAAKKTTRELLSGELLFSERLR